MIPIAPMRVLAIDCSTEWLAVAAGDATGCVERREHAGQSHSQRVLPRIDAVLTERGWRVADLDGIAFGAGPGSFTGVRIACGVAQGLALGASRPVVPVATLEALAQQAFRAHDATRVYACLDARMREVYVAAYEREGNGWREVQPPAVVKPGDVVIPDGEWFGAGEGFSAYPELAKHPAFRAVDATLAPSGCAMIELAAPRLAAGQGVDAAHALPLYVRHRVALTSAERAAGVRL
jgi:tRNA threonylcarbamoyladenosine biosynthesis protein TsaB